jgi:hypothetical protein
MHLYYDVPKPLKFSQNDLKDELRADKAMEMDIKPNYKLPNLHGIYHDQYTDLASKASIVHSRSSLLSIAMRWTFWMPVDLLNKMMQYDPAH